VKKVYVFLKEAIEYGYFDTIFPNFEGYEASLGQLRTRVSCLGS